MERTSEIPKVKARLEGWLKIVQDFAGLTEEEVEILRETFEGSEKYMVLNFGRCKV